MKKSNQIILAAIGAVFIFSIAFQLNVNRYLRHSESKKENVVSISKERTVNSFNKISVSDGIEVYFSQDSITNIKIEASENTIANIMTTVENETLILQKSEQTRNEGVIKVFVLNNQLNAVKARSGAYFETMSEVSGDALALDFSSDTKANLELSYESILCKAASGSQIKFKGNTSNIEFTN